METAFAVLLVFARTGALVMVTPGFAEPGPPARVRLAFALVLALALAPIAGARTPAPPESALGLGLFVAGEVVVGLALGAMTRLLLSAMAVAGQIIATQAGMALAVSFDPSQGQQGAIYGAFLNLSAITLMFSVNLHHGLLQALAESYATLGPGAPVATGDFAALALAVFTEAFDLAIRMAAPLLVFGLVFNFGLGVLARLMPQLQVFFVAMPLNVLLGVIMFAATFGAGLLLWLDHAQAFVASMV